MSSDYDIARYVKPDRPAVFDFIRAAYPPKESARMLAQWDWKYDANPFNREPEPYILLWRDAGEIVGLLGALSLRVCIEGTEHWVGHLCDWMVRRDHRGRRMARRLLDRQRPDWPVRFAWQNEISRRLSPGMVGDTSGMLRLAPLAKPLAVGDLVEHATGSHLLGRLAGAVVKWVRPLSSLLRPRTTVPGLSVSETNTFDERFDALWEHACRDYGVMIVRDRRYLQWRFADRPDAHYRTFVATRGANVVGYMVVRVVERDGACRGYLVDFLVAERSMTIFSLLLQPAVACVAQDGAKAISCRAVVPPYRRVLYRHGFLPVRERAYGYLRTYRPNVESPNRFELVFQDVQRWFLTMGDGDLEMAF